MHLFIKFVLCYAVFVSISTAATTTHWFTQKINHTNPNDERTFKQKYYVNYDLAQDQYSPVFLYVCGEGPCSAKSISNIKVYAKEFNASVVALEHRYYGESHPFKDLRVKNLKYLTVENALKDLLSFQKYMVVENGLKGPWIVVGGSYPGNLAAYYRQKYPNMVVGAIASSAPVKAKYNFKEYDQHVLKVAGPSCGQKLQALAVQLEKALNDPQEMEILKSYFDAQYIENDMDFAFFTADVTSFAVQYGYKDQLCRYLTNMRPIVAVAKFANYIQRNWGHDASEFSFEKAKDIAINKNSSMRQWFFQTCFEMGYFQAAHSDPRESMRASFLNQAYFERGCREVYGIDFTDIEGFNEKYYYPLLDQSTTNIIFTNGDEDPWQHLSINKEIAREHNPNLESYLIPGAAHCDDLGSTTSDAVKKVQGYIIYHIQNWLEIH